VSPIRTVLAIVGCCLLLVGCGSRPSEADLTASILDAANANGSKVTLSMEQATCIARELLASGLSDTTLSGLADNFDQPQVLESEASKVEPAVADAALKCQ
jgi:hypothetical protein